MKRHYYSNSIQEFLKSSTPEILGSLSTSNEFDLTQTQRDAWIVQITSLQEVLTSYHGSIYFEYAIPRMGRRIDVVLLLGAVIFVIEFKVGERDFSRSAIDQVQDYALDLMNFHEASHRKYIAPILIATEANTPFTISATTPHNDTLLSPVLANKASLKGAIETILAFADETAPIHPVAWENSRYCPTPTIIEAAMALYNNHSVSDISRNDANATNLSKTSKAISEIIEVSKRRSQKSICFVTGVPGAGKTLVGLDIATKHIRPDDELYSVYLSGNGPLVKILCEALARDRVRRGNENGLKVRIGEARSEVKGFIQNVHHFRDDCLSDKTHAPIEHVAIFDEAQRAWNAEQTSTFMLRKKKTPNFNLSEPEFLISCLDRHRDWALIICLVGGGQEINTGEAGIGEWLTSIQRSYPHWNVYISSKLTDSEYNISELLKQLPTQIKITHLEELHLAVSMRSFRSEHVSLFIKQMLDLNIELARKTYQLISSKYPIVVTRDLKKAKQWLKAQARGSERYGIVVSSQAERLKPHAIDVKSPIDPIHWFLDDKDDVRSSYYLEDVATEFHVQGLELDWVCVTWDADFRHTSMGWEHYSFSGNRWLNIRKAERKQFLKNAYRVLLTRARQGMVIVVPNGDEEDFTRNPAFYDSTFEYLVRLGMEVI